MGLLWYERRSGSRGEDVVQGNTSTPMYPAEMLHQVLLPRKTGAGAALAVGERAHAESFGSAMLLVHFALMAKQAVGIGKALDLLAAGFVADVWPVVLVYVFPSEKQAVLAVAKMIAQKRAMYLLPFALPGKDLRISRTGSKIAIQLTLAIAWKFLNASTIPSRFSTSL